LEQEYNVKTDWDAKRYFGMNIEKSAGNLYLSMPNYVEAALERFCFQSLGKPVNSPAKYEPPVYGKKSQMAMEIRGAQISAKQKEFVQEVVGTFLYYARAVDPTMLTQLNKIATRLPEATDEILEQVQHFLGYAATFPDAVTIVKPSGMRLVVHSDASYLSETKARSRAGGVCYLTSADDDLMGHSCSSPVDSMSSIIPTVVAAASEAEYAALFMNGQNAIAIGNTLADLGYPQDPILVVTDNTTAESLANESAKIKRSKSIDMRYHWVRDKCRQKLLNVVWRTKIGNKADLFTKTLPVADFLKSRSQYVFSNVEPKLVAVGGD
jgi:hypothetical protein